MKQLLKYILNRYWWFMLYYRQWIINPDGIKGFSEQYLSHLLDRTLYKSKQLKQENETLKDKRSRLEQERLSRSQDRTIPLGELDSTRRIINRSGFYVALMLIGETYLIYIIMQVFTGLTKNLLDGLLKFALSFVATLIVVVIVEKMINQFMLLFVHKDEKEKGSIPALIFFAILTIFLEVMTYNFAMVRAQDFEGSNMMGSVGIALALLSMLLPFAAGFVGYEFMKHFGPYRNTMRLQKIEKELGKIEQQLKVNEEEEQHYFLMQCSDRYAVIDEFRIYKNNYAAKKGLPKEDLSNHFCETRESFFAKAKEEYERRLKSQVTILFQLEKIKASQNGTYSDIIIPNA